MADTCAVCKRPRHSRDAATTRDCFMLAYEREKAASASLREQLARVTRERDEARFMPMGDNHHNAAACPYCGDPLRAARSRIEALERILKRIDAALAPQSPLLPPRRRNHEIHADQTAEGARAVPRRTLDRPGVERGEGHQRAAEGCDLFTAEQLHRAFDPEGRWTGRGVLSSLGKALANAGFRNVNGGQPMQTGDGKIHRLIAVRNPVRWEQATRPELREHYDQFFGPQHAGEVK